MPIPRLLQEAGKFEIQSYKTPKNPKELRKAFVPFSGSPKQHPYDPDKVILIADPYSSNTFYYEFKTADISYLEELPAIVTIDGDVAAMIRIWVKKMSLGVRCMPFIVEDTSF